MNILLRFEDRYGCSSLFKNYFPEYKDCDCIDEGLSNSGAFSIERTFFDSYDLIIFVYDLDSYGNGNLMIGKDSFDEATNWMLSYIDKIVFIPIFFCFETLVLFSPQLRNLISMPSKFRRGDTANTLVRYKEQYDYSVLVPEFLDNYKEKMGLIKPDKDIFYPQEFHQSYMRELLRSLYLKANSDEIRKKSKNIDLLFEYLKDFQLFK